jgi:hypothetical protein
LIETHVAVVGENNGAADLVVSSAQYRLRFGRNNGPLEMSGEVRFDISSRKIASAS